MKKHSNILTTTTCSLAVVLSNIGAAGSAFASSYINYYSGSTDNKSNGSKVITDHSGKGDKIGEDSSNYRSLYTIKRLQTPSNELFNGLLDKSSDVDGSAIKKFTDTLDKGFSFAGWKLNTDSKIHQPGDTLPTGKDTNYTAVAQWKDEKNTVTINGAIAGSENIELKDGEEVIGSVALKYISNYAKENIKVESTDKANLAVIDSIDEQFTFTDLAEGVVVTATIGETDPVDKTNDIENDVLTINDVTEDVEMTVAYKTFDLSASVTDEEHASVSPISAVKYGHAATFDVAIDDGFKVSKVLKGEEETELTVNEEGELIIENVAADAEYTIVVEPEVYEIIEGAGQDVDVSKIDKAIFRFDAPYERFIGVAIDGKAFFGYESYPGSTYVAVDSAELAALGSGEHNLTAYFDNNTSVGTNFTVSGIPTTPETGANSKLGASTVVSALAYAVTGSALALALLAIKRKMNR